MDSPNESSASQQPVKPQESTKEQKPSAEEQRAYQEVQELKGFYKHLMTYCMVIGGLFLFNLLTSPSNLWVKWPAFGWGIGIAIHAVNTFGLFDLLGPEWEKREIEKRLGKKTDQ